MSTHDIRWIQRFNNFKKASEKLQDAVTGYRTGDMSELEKEGLIQRYEYTFELAWKTLQDLLYHRGYLDLKEPTLVLKQALLDGYIGKEKLWRRMKEARELTSHTYDEDKANEIAEKIASEFSDPLLELLKKLETEVMKDMGK